MPVTLKLNRGILANLPALSAGEPAFTTDQFRLYVGSAGGNRLLGVLDKIDATAAPGVGDDSADGYSPSSMWVDTTNDKAYICLDATVGAAVWQQVGAGGGSGDVVGPAGATDNALARFDGATGKLLQDSAAALTDAGALTVTYTEAGTSNTEVLTLVHNTSGSPAAGFGLFWHVKLQTSTTPSVAACDYSTFWEEVTHATRKAGFSISVYDTSPRTVIRGGTTGSAPTVGFLGATPIQRGVSPELGALMVSLGFASGTPTFQSVNLIGVALPSTLVATQAEQETGTSTVLAVTPGRQQYHDSAAKAWVLIDASSGTPVISDSYNVSSITDRGVGLFTVNFTIAFSSVNYVAAGFCGTPGTSNGWIAESMGRTTTAYLFACFTNTNVLTDFSRIMLVFFGDQ